MKTLLDIINEKRQGLNQVSGRGGEKNFIIANEFIPPLNMARKVQNGINYRIARKKAPGLTRDQFKAGKAYFKPLTHGRIAAILKGKDKQELYMLLANCKQSRNFSEYFWGQVKKWKISKQEQQPLS